MTIIKDSFKKSRKTYVYRRIHDDFVDLGETCGKQRIARIMIENDICPKIKRKFKVTMDSKHNKPIHGNHLNRELKQKPCEISKNIL